MNMKTKSPVKISKSYSSISYDDNINMWSADMVFNIDKKEILIFGLSRKLFDCERSNIITEILNKYCFGNYIYLENDIYLCKLKNRGLEKKEEMQTSGTLDEMSYSILGETIMELSKNSNENRKISDIRSLYLNLKLSVEEAVTYGEELSDMISFEYTGANLYEYCRFLKIIENIKPEFENSFERILGKKVEINIVKSKLINKKATIYFELKEAN